MNIMKSIKRNLLLCISVALFSTNAIAAVTVIVNPANSANIDEGDISRIFLGKIKAYSSGDTVTIVNLRYDQETRNEFEEKVLNKNPSQVKAYWSKLMFSGKGKPPKELASDKDIIAFIADNPGAIGYVAEASVNSSVKVIKTF